MQRQKENNKGNMNHWDDEQFINNQHACEWWAGWVNKQIRFEWTGNRFPCDAGKVGEKKNSTRQGGRAWLSVFTFSGGSFIPRLTLCWLVAVPPSVQNPRSRLSCVYQRCRLAIWVPLAGATHKSALQLLHSSLGAHLQCWRCSCIDAGGCDVQLVPAKAWGQLMNLAFNQRTVIYFSSPGQMPEWTDWWQRCRMSVSPGSADFSGLIGDKMSGFPTSC